jgi:hypothetical protein
MTSKTISTTVTTTVDITAGGVEVNGITYPSYNGITVAATTGIVNPTLSVDGATGVYSNFSGAVLTNYGSISGNVGTAVNGGIGVDFTAMGTINNDAGGGIYGGESLSGNGGVALDVLGAGSLINNKYSITGGSADTTGSGGDGVDLAAAAEVHNYALGVIRGGSTASGSGGIGVNMTASGATLVNDMGGTITGGISFKGASGVGVDLAAGATITNAGSIVGGNSNSGSGGAGADLAAGATMTNTGSIAGGYSDLGSAGAGVDLAAANATMTNAGSIVGGNSFNGSAGGAGVDLAANATMTNGGSITGGYSTSGSGGAGADLASGATMTNTGSLTGGNSSSGSGGAGVILNGGMLTTSGSIARGEGSGSLSYSYAVDFQSSSTMAVGSGATFTGDIGGFLYGDKIDITNLAPSVVSADFTAGTDTIATGADGTLIFAGASGDTFLFSSDTNGGTDVTIACFRCGTRILAERGEVAIESLKIGDRVMTMSGITKPIRWIGRRSYSGETARDNTEVLPILIRAGALADDLPRRDLWVSPEHAMFIDGMLIPAAALVNGVSIVQEDSIEEVAYIHLEFDSHAVIYAEGAASESFVDDESRAMFDNAAEYARLYPNAAPEPARFCAPRTEDGEELEIVRERLAARAEHLRATYAGEPHGFNMIRNPTACLAVTR